MAIPSKPVIQKKEENKTLPKTENAKHPFCLKKENSEKFRYMEGCTLTELLKELNRISNKSEVDKLTREVLINTLIALDLIKKDGDENEYTLIVTGEGKQAGIKTEYGTNRRRTT